MVIATSSWTAHGQEFSTDSVTITRDQQRQCIKWNNTVQYYRDTVVPIKDTMIQEKDEWIEYQEKEIEKRDERIQKQNKKIKRRTWISGATGATVGAIIAAFLVGLVK